MKDIEYEYRNCPIPGGGYVTGFLFGKVDKNAFYIRTDIGGTYRYNKETKRFESLIDYVNMNDLAPTYVAGICTDGRTLGSLYVACGLDGKRDGELLVSKDYGKSFLVENLPCKAHGNKNGRGTGKRLIFDEKKRELFFASYEDGLLSSKDEGKTWKKTSVCGENHLTFVFLLPDTDTLIVATSGIDTKLSEKRRGHSLYISYDRGNTFEKMEEPETGVIEGSRMSGLVGHRYAYDGKYFYVTANHTGERAYVVESGYSSDCGQVIGGMVLRYSFLESGKISKPSVISPNSDFKNQKYGYGGIGAAYSKEGMLALSTITRDEGDIVYRSTDFGENWEPVLEGLTVGDISFNTSYMKPCYNGGNSLIHWLTDIEFNPFDDNEVWFNTGTGVFKSENFTKVIPSFFDWSDGIEETVHLNVYAPTGSDVKVIDIVGDLGGFAFRDIDKPCDNSFADSEGNRYITCINADYPDMNPETVIVTPRGNWTGKTKGGLIISKDACRTFERLNLPYGLTEKLDRHFSDIERPNVNSGWVAISSDGENIVWSVADGIKLPMDMVVVSNDGGKTFKCVTFVSAFSDDKQIKVYADRVNKNLFFGFTEKGSIYVSKDGGRSFQRIVFDNPLEDVNFGLIDCANKTEIRGESGKEGVFYVASGYKGLWKLEYNLEEENMSVHRLSKAGDEVYRVGLGINKGSKDFFNDQKAVYMCAKIDGQLGFYRSFDDLDTIEHINNEDQMFGEINGLDADKREFGYFYIATGSRGILYGREKTD